MDSILNSAIHNINVGVPQGPELVPVVFLININYLPTINTIHSFVDKSNRLSFNDPVMVAEH